MRFVLLLVSFLCSAIGADPALGLGPVPTNSTLLAPGPIGSTTPSSGAFTTLNASGLITGSAGASIGPSASAASAGIIWLSRATAAATLGFQTNGVSEAMVKVTATGVLSVCDGSASVHSSFDTAAGGLLTLTTNAGGIAVQRTTGTNLALSSTDPASMTLAGGTTIAGNVVVTAAGSGLKLKEGTNARMGTATLVAGAATVANTSVTASTRIFLTSNVDGGAPGFLRVSARVASTSFTITSSSGTDTSTVAWLLVEPSP